MTTVINRLAIISAAVLACSAADAAYIVKIFPPSSWSAKTAVLDSTLGLTGKTIDTFETLPLIAGLSVTLSGNYPTATFTALPKLRGTASLFASQTWDGNNFLTNIGYDGGLNFSAGYAKTDFTYAPGTKFFGVGLVSAQSATGADGSYNVIGDHEIYVNGVLLGTIEALGGGKFVGSFGRNGYIEIAATGSDIITDVRFANVGGTSDVLAFDRLAVDAVPAPAPEPAAWMLMIAGFGAVGAATRFRLATHANRESRGIERAGG